MRLPQALRLVRAMSAGAAYTREEFASIRTHGPAGTVGQDVPDALRGDRSIDHSTIVSSVSAIAQAAANSHRRRG